jgi:hypothetical protein
LFGGKKSTFERTYDEETGLHTDHHTSGWFGRKKSTIQYKMPEHHDEDHHSAPHVQTHPDQMHHDVQQHDPHHNNQQNVSHAHAIAALAHLLQNPNGLHAGTRVPPTGHQSPQSPNLPTVPSNRQLKRAKKAAKLAGRGAAATLNAVNHAAAGAGVLAANGASTAFNVIDSAAQSGKDLTSALGPNQMLV